MRRVREREEEKEMGRPEIQEIREQGDGEIG
jgi:hypothetical protein